MADPRGFITIERRTPPRRPVEERVRDWKDVYRAWDEGSVREQGRRCMDCGVPFCHQGCPLGNLIPDWNDLVSRAKWRQAIDRLHATNNFPEWTGKLCPAPCEDACVLNINDDPVAIKQVEWEIIRHAYDEGWVGAQPPAYRTGKKVAVIGSGPAGLAAAQQLNREGHLVTVYERDDRIGGLVRYGIPDYKMDKRQYLDRRLAILQEEGIAFRPNSEVGGNVPVERLRTEFDAVVLATGALKSRDLGAPGRELGGIHFAMPYLTMQNRRIAGDEIPEDRFVSAEGKHVVIVGGGDTGADCYGTALRQGARSVTQLQWRPVPPKERAPDNPWPEYANIFRTSAAHEEGGSREFSISTKQFVGRDGRVCALEVCRVEYAKDERGRTRVTEIPGTAYELPADLVLIATGFEGTDATGLAAQLGLELSERGTFDTDRAKMTKQPGVFAAGDASMGQSLIVNAIAEGRQVAEHVDRYLRGGRHTEGGDWTLRLAHPEPAHAET